MVLFLGLKRKITQQRVKERKNLEIHNKHPWIYNESRRVHIHKSKETCKITKNQISLDKHLTFRLKNIEKTRQATKINKAISRYKKQQKKKQQNLQQTQSRKQSNLLTLSSEKTQQATKKIIVQCTTTKQSEKMIRFN